MNFSRYDHFWLGLKITFFLLISFQFGRVQGAPNGKKIYETKCLSCHGLNGEGVKGKYNKPLSGDLTPNQLAKIIEETMPKEDPGSLSEADALAVSAYIHEGFYSSIARERNRPARIELSRLTVRQYRNSMMDLVGSFRPNAVPSDKTKGLRGEYFKTRNFNKGDLAESRIDAEVDFDFKEESPIPGKMEPGEFTLRWTGAIHAPETGYYEFVIHASHAVRLWVNDKNTPLIDAWVKSGKDTEYKGSIYLISGHSYSLRLEFTKAKQGVNDNKKPKVVQPAFVKLLWKKPGGPVEICPGEYLSTLAPPEMFVCSTPFPPDDGSLGWERGSTVSKEWDQATTEGALEAAKYITSKLPEFTKVKDGDPLFLEKTEEFLKKFASRAFRRNLQGAESEFIKKVLKEFKDPQDGALRVLVWILKSPNFLYRNEGQGGALASQLSYILWDSIPDQQLLDAEASGKLKNVEGLNREIDRMLLDSRAQEKIRVFFHDILLLNQTHELNKDASRFPGFDSKLESDLRISLDKSIEEVFWEKDSSYQRLFLEQGLFMNERIAKFYQQNTKSKTGFEKVSLDAGQRAGIVTHPYMLSMLSYSAESSPIHRGVFLARSLLGVSLKPPPEAAAPLAASLHPSLTTRERVALQTKGGACMTCHATINSLGFTLERFDAVGRLREKDNSKLIDSSGWYVARDGKKIAIENAQGLGQYLASSPDAHRAFAEQMFHHLLKQPTRAYGAETLEQLTRYFEKNSLNMRKLAGEMARMACTEKTGVKLQEVGKQP
ncbi:MAG: DUF1592 domain-containing protein [Planctomycetes bacterium]|nr:DUF1592 domain-containing protein [Planctomycetota bacterium]NBY02155.1 DUF1592 domain-containing protein [Planctomycetota bacterium]